MSLPEKVSVTATLSVIKTGPQHASAVASVKEVTCFVQAEQKLIGLPSLQGARGPAGTTDYNDLTNKPTLGTMSAIDDAPSDGSEYVRKNGNWAVSSGGGSGTIYWGDIEGTLSNQTDLQTALDAKANTADLGTMASVNDAASDSKTYGRQNGAWVEVTGGGGGSVDWGDIGGTLSDQDDLYNALLSRAYEGDLANEFSTSQSYTAGTCVIYQHRLFMFRYDKSAGAWDDSVVWMMPMANILRYQLSAKANTADLGTMASINDAPSDGSEYVRKNGSWAVSSGGGGGGSTDWNDITNKPSTFPPSSHTHDDRYYTESETDALLADKADTADLGDLAGMNAIDYTSNYLTNKPTLGTMAAESASDYYDKTDVDDALDAKQDALSFDSTPTAGSTNPVESGGIKTALDAKQDTLTFDTTPTASSANPVTSGGVYTAIHGRALHISMASTLSLGTISNASITTTMRVVNIVWGNPENVLSDVTWNTNTAGQLVLSGTLAGATTAEIDLIDFG